MDEDHEKELVSAFLGEESGVFIEVGANHPTGGSQTWHLAQRGWRGIIVEPLRKYYDLLVEKRPESTIFKAACTSPQKAGTILLHIPAEDGFATVEPNKDDFDVKYDETESVAAKTLESIIEEWRTETKQIDRIRFVSVDVEGHELDVLMGLNLKKHRPDLLLIEDKLQDLTKHRYLKSAGYKLFRRTSMNNWYVPEEYKLQGPGFLEQLKLFRKVFLGLPFRALRRWRRAKNKQ